MGLYITVHRVGCAVWDSPSVQGDPETPRVQAGIDDNARPEADVVREVVRAHDTVRLIDAAQVRQMVLDNYEDVMIAFEAADPAGTVLAAL